MAMNAFRVYNRLLHERPFITNVLTIATFMTLGDLNSQVFLQKKEVIDYKQTKEFALAGLIFVGPMARVCIVLLERLFGPTRSMTGLVKKVAFDQTINAPIFILGNITTLTLIKTGSFGEVKTALARSYYNILMLNYSFWPFVQFINFYIIPVPYRVIFGSLAGLVYNTVLSFRLNEKPHDEL